MPRRKSTKPAPAPTPTSSKPKARKRALSSSATAAPTAAAAVSSTPGSRASKRLKESTIRSPSTAKKSKYFEGPDSDEDDEEEDEVASADEEASDFNEVDDASVADPSSASPSPSASEDEEEDDDVSEGERPKPKKRGRKPATTAAKPGRVAGAVSAVVEAGKELWRAGVKTGLAPGQQVFIERPKPRGDGGIKYVPGRVHQNTMAFLADLKKNNDREWLKMHDPDYRTSWNDWSTFVESLTEKIAEKDETIPELPSKDLVFRIYRDVRFSSDPTPYKTHFSAAWSRTGRKGPYACYYLQIAPGGGSFVVAKDLCLSVCVENFTSMAMRREGFRSKGYVGTQSGISLLAARAGLWMPEAQPLALLRANIDRNPEVMRRVLTDAALRKAILGVSANDEKKAIKAFALQNAENALKTKPKGYDADNPNIELLRLRNFTIGKKISDEEVTSPSGLDTIVNLISTMTPFVTYLNDVVMPDSTGSSAESGSESGESEAEEAE